MIGMMCLCILTVVASLLRDKDAGIVVQDAQGVSDHEVGAPGEPVTANALFARALAANGLGDGKHIEVRAAFIKKERYTKCLKHVFCFLCLKSVQSF